MARKRNHGFGSLPMDNEEIVFRPISRGKHLRLLISQFWAMLMKPFGLVILFFIFCIGQAQAILLVHSLSILPSLSQPFALHVLDENRPLYTQNVSWYLRFAMVDIYWTVFIIIYQLLTFHFMMGRNDKLKTVMGSLLFYVIYVVNLAGIPPASAIISRAIFASGGIAIHVTTSLLLSLWTVLTVFWTNLLQQ